MLAIGIIGTVVSRTRALPTWAKYLATTGVVAALVPPSVALQGVLPPGYPFLPVSAQPGAMMDWPCRVVRMAW